MSHAISPRLHLNTRHIFHGDLTLNCVYLLLPLLLLLFKFGFKLHDLIGSHLV